MTEQKVVTYTCSRCSTETDSTQDNNGWAFNPGVAYCPTCFPVIIEEKRKQ